MEIILGGEKYTIEEIIQKQRGATNFDNVSCNVENMLRYVKLRALLNSAGNCKSYDPIPGVRKYGFVKLVKSYLPKGKIDTLSKIATIADDFLYVDGKATFAVYDIWEDNDD